MENQKLPNATPVLVLGILSVLTCCCGWGIGVVCGIVALVLAKKDIKLFQETPDQFDNYKTLNAGKILSIIGIVLSSITLMTNIYFYTVVGEKGTKEMMENLITKMKYEQGEE